MKAFRSITLSLLVCTCLLVRAQAQDAVDQFIQSAMQEQHIPGLALLVSRAGEPIRAKGYGLANIELQVPVKPETVFQSGSVGKQFTATAVMMLVEEGKIALDDEVQTFIPSWKNLGVYVSGIPSLTTNTSGQFITAPPARRMKVIDLATHTSGLTYGFLYRTPVDAEYRRAKVGEFHSSGGLDAMVDQLSKLPLDFSPGDHWNYSLAIDVLGYLVQQISGQTFGEFLRTRIFAPLGMKDTGFSVPADKLDRFASCYMPKKGGGLELQDDAQKSHYLEPPKLESGGGGLVSTAHDYMRFCRMMLNGGELDGVRILSPKTVEMFSLNLLPDNKLLTDMEMGKGMFSEAGYAGIGFSIGCGVTVDTRKTHIPGSEGEYFWGGAAATAFWIDPVEDMTVVFMTQVMGTEARLSLRRDLRTLAYSAIID